jgi:transforming growth factor-beta-induced protein
MRDSSPAEQPTIGRRDAAGRMTMKKMLKSAVVAAGVTVMVLAGGVAQAAEKNIVETAVAAGSFTTLAKALQAAGLVDTLNGNGPFTVFAPTDEAFAKLPEGTIEELLKPENKAKLQAILTYHVVAGKVMASQVIGLKSAKTVNGQSVTIAVMDGGVMIDNAHVVKTDIPTSNGVIHVIDTVLLPAAK